MYEIPQEPKKIRERIKRYERKLREERRKYGDIGDGSGKRYLLGPLYLLMDDLDGALESFRWFEEEFSDDSGEPGHHLCWTLALYRSGNFEKAARMLKRTMFTNLYLIPHLLGQDIEKIDMWHGSNEEEPDYLAWIPPEYFLLWDEETKKWASGLYHSKEFQDIVIQYIEIQRKLLNLSPGHERTRLVNEAYTLIEQ
jgi:hypothetical protein